MMYQLKSVRTLSVVLKRWLALFSICPFLWPIMGQGSEVPHWTGPVSVYIFTQF